jgi:hypothetical protein
LFVWWRKSVRKKKGMLMVAVTCVRITPQMIGEARE